MKGTVNEDAEMHSHIAIWLFVLCLRCLAQ